MSKFRALFFLLLACFSCQEASNVNTSKQVDVPLEPKLEVANFDIEKEIMARSVGTQSYLFGVPIMTMMYFRNRMHQMVKISKSKENQFRRTYFKRYRKRN